MPIFITFLKNLFKTNFVIVKNKTFLIFLNEAEV